MSAFFLQIPVTLTYQPRNNISNRWDEPDLKTNTFLSQHLVTWNLNEEKETRTVSIFAIETSTFHAHISPYRVCLQIRPVISDSIFATFSLKVTLSEEGTKNSRFPLTAETKSKKKTFANFSSVFYVILVHLLRRKKTGHFNFRKKKPC